jgi:hypothetical protein
MVLAGPAPGGRIAVIRAEMVPASCEAMAAFIDDALARYAVAMLALEWAVGGAFDRFRVSGLIAAMGVAGELSALAWDREIPIRKVDARTWRASVIGRIPRAPKIAGVELPRPKADEWIARALPMFATGMGVTNVHQRDAIGLAVWGSRVAWRRVAA